MNQTLDLTHINVETKRAFMELNKLHRWTPKPPTPPAASAALRKAA